MFWVLIAGLVPGVLFGIIYPAAAVLYYKLKTHGRLSCRQILKMINY